MREKPYFIFLISIIFYFFLTWGISKDEREEREDSVTVPKWLMKIVFPYNTSIKMPLAIVITAIYLILSNAIVYMTYLCKCTLLNHVWSWNRVNDMWILSTFLLMYIILMLTLGILIIKSKTRKVVQLILLLADIAFIGIGLHYIIIPLVIRYVC